MNNRLICETGIPLPNGARLVEATSFMTSFARPDDTYTERLVLDVNGRRVQILRYDKSNAGVVVYVGDHAKLVPMGEVVGHIEAHTERR